MTKNEFDGGYSNPYQKQTGGNDLMIEMFWAEKYAMATGLTLVVRKLFRPKGKADMWVSALTASASIMSMNLGAGLLYPYSTEQWIFGIAEGVFAGSAILAVWMILKKLFLKRISSGNTNPNFLLASSALNLSV